MVRDRKRNRDFSAEADRKKAMKYASRKGRVGEDRISTETKQSTMSLRSGTHLAADKPPKEGK